MSKIEPIKFKEANRNLLKPESMTDDECKSLWVFTDGTECISCWKIPLWKRIKFLFHGKIWLFVLSGGTQPPVEIMCENNVFTHDN